MACHPREDLPLYRPPEEIKVPGYIKYLVTGKFIGKPQGGINHLFLVNQHHIREPPSPCQPHLLQLSIILYRAVCPGRGNLFSENLRAVKDKTRLLFSDRRGIVHHIMNGKFMRRLNGDISSVFRIPHRSEEHTSELH